MNWTIKNLITWATNYFKDKGLESARLDTELMLAQLLGVERIQLYLMFDKPLGESELARFKEMVKRRAAREPVAYITGKKEFWSRSFEVNPHVLIPRPETELLTECVLNWLHSRPKDTFTGPVVRGFEMGLGSGAISVTLLAEMPHLIMDAVDISEQAIAVAKQNATTHNVFNRLNIAHDDFVVGVRFIEPVDQYDFIVANPPYVATAQIQTLDDDVKKFEPVVALDGGDNGLKFYDKLADFAKRTVIPQGLLAVEIGEEQGNAVSEIFKTAGFSRVEVKKDYAKLDRVVLAYI